MKMGCEPEGRGLGDCGHAESMTDVASVTNKNGILESLFPSSSLKICQSWKLGAQEHREGIVSYLWRHGLRKKERETEGGRKEARGKERGREGGGAFIQ